jgi:hypothetical protein
MPANTCCEKGRPGRVCDDCASISAAYQADMAPRRVCIGCDESEAAPAEQFCPECRGLLEQAGILKPKNQRVPIGPLDV